jgi:hypothetical protein
VEECTAALEYDESPGSFKLDQLLRRSRAYERREKYGLAVADMQLARGIAPSSIQVQKESNRLEKKMASLSPRESHTHVYGSRSQQSDHSLTSASASRLQRGPSVVAAPSPAPRRMKIDMFGSDSDSD